MFGETLPKNLMFVAVLTVPWMLLYEPERSISGIDLRSVSAGHLRCDSVRSVFSLRNWLRF